ncbi:putative membrane protein [Escherichia coli DEC15A]|nr:putative membrane protein [Shigella flexneri K-272]EHX97554.1 putative membrane protein [Escherichia coli DEC15A]
MGDDYFSLLSAAIALLPMTIVLIMIAMLRFFSFNFMPLASVAFLQ